MPQGDPLQYAVDAEKNLEALATQLAQMGAPEQTVEAVEQMAEVTRQIVKALGKGQSETGDDEPPAEEEAAGQPRTIGEATDQMVDEARSRQRER